MTTPTTPPLDMLLDATVFFSMILALALVIERVLEVLKVIYDYIDGRCGWHRLWTARAQRLKVSLERRMRAFVDPDAAHGVLRRVSDHILNERGAYQGTVLVLSADVVRATTVRAVSKIIGMALGIAIAFWQDVDLIALYRGFEQGAAIKAAGLEHTLHVILTGVTLGLGAGPVHKIITTIERKYKERVAERKEGAST